MIESVDKAIQYLKRKFKDNIVVICLSMHSRCGEKELVNILNMNIDKIPVYVIGNERWGLNINEVQECQYFIRLGPSTGIPMSSSEVIAYTTILTRFVKTMRKDYKSNEIIELGSR